MMPEFLFQFLNPGIMRGVLAEIENIHSEVVNLIVDETLDKNN